MDPVLILLVVNLVAGLGCAIPLAGLLARVKGKPRRVLVYFAILIGVYFLEGVALAMGMGIPVLHGVAGESAEIVQKNGIGLIFRPEDAADLCRNLIKLRGDTHLCSRLKNNCLKTAGGYNRVEKACEMLDYLEKCVAIHRMMNKKSEIPLRTDR